MRPQSPSPKPLLLKLASTLLVVLLSSASHTSVIADKTVLSIGNSQLMITFNSDFSAAEQHKLLQWIKVVSQASTHVYGRLPLATITIEFIADRNAKEPVPFGKINRGATQGISFYINPEYPLEDFIQDWTAYHEFSHLMIPYPGDDGRWFSEGLASYYQNIIMGRAGVQTPLQAWQRLYAGFVRGANDTKMQHLSLKQLSPRMHASRSFMRVYWSGAYYFFAVDIALRKQQLSLDKVLAQLQRCCLAIDRDWTALQLVKQLDDLSGTTVFSQQYSAIIQSKSLQGFETKFNAIGLTLTNGNITARANGNNEYQKIIQARP